MRGLVVLVSIAVAGTTIARAEPAAGTLPWSQFRTPSRGAPQSVGGYSSGCVLGAVALPAVGPGFAVVWPDRRRVYGHPVVVDFIRELGRRTVDSHLPRLSVGDLGQARGGPAPTGHASHQSGLDVDLFFLPPEGEKTTSLVDDAHRRPGRRFTEATIRLLALAAADTRVDRIFINPVLKRALCQRSPGEHDWLRKLTPWWGHDDHFHVRLACPPESPACVPQAPLAAGDGCAEIDWWFDEKAQADRAKAHKKYASRVGAAPELPAACRELLQNGAAKESDGRVDRREP
jgi:penicillin-insensitive murein endopeptidase